MIRVPVDAKEEAIGIIIAIDNIIDANDCASQVGEAWFLWWTCRGVVDLNPSIAIDTHG
jgi:hypothetical protein